MAALASWLDARAHGGTWLLRIEDVDPPRCVPGADRLIQQQLAALGLVPDGPVWQQSTRGACYQTALDQLVARQRAYPCACTRRDIALAQAAAGHVHERHAEWVYPGTCRVGLGGRPARAWRFAVEPLPNKFDSKRAQPLSVHSSNAINLEATHNLHWHDRRLGPQHQDVAQAVGDFVLRRADGLWAYQLAVVVDDAAQGVTHVVRGEDLCDNTPRQILLQQALGLPQPKYLHTPLVRAADGEKLSKQHGAPALDTHSPAACAAALAAAGAHLGLPPPHPGATSADTLARWVAAWDGLYNPSP